VTVDAPEPKAPVAARRSPPNFVGFVLTIAMVWLGGQFVTQGMSDALLGGDPELAVLWRGDSADAVAVLARARLTSHNRDGAVRLAAHALQLAPLNASALATYGLAMEQLGHQPQADQAMAVAGKLGWRDVLTQLWLFRRGLIVGDFDAALDHADALMRRQDDVPKALFVALGAAAHDPRLSAPLIGHLRADPAWRAPFFDYLGGYAKPPETDVARTLLTGIAAGPTPPTNDELASYLRSLVGEQKFAQAASDWRLFSRQPGLTGYVYDGDFQRPAGATPFDWALANGVGWSAAVTDSPGAGHGQALRLEYDGVSPPQPVRQMLVLPPGSYRLSGRAYNEGDSDPKALTWGVICLTSAQVLAGVPTPAFASAQWRAFEVNLTVPAEHCPAQWLVLSATPGDVRQDISVWYDDIMIAPVAAPAVAASPGH
jgi:hypothetical protein